MSKGKKILFLSNRNLPTDGWGRYSYEIQKGLNHFPANIVHALIEPLILKALFFSFIGKKLVITVHGTHAFVLCKSKLGFLYRFALRRAKAIIVASRYTRKRLLETFPELEYKIQIIPLGTHLSISKERLRPIKQTFLMVGEIKQRKGVKESILAFSQLVSHYPLARLEIVGKISNSNYVREIKALIKTLDLEDRIFLKGILSEKELKQTYREALCLLAPSINHGYHFEGFGIIHLEANSMGLPTIGSLNCGNEEVIKHGYNGFLVNQGDIVALKETMMKFLSKDFPWNKYSRQSIDWAKRHSWQTCCELHKKVYLQCLSNKGRDEILNDIKTETIVHFNN